MAGQPTPAETLERLRKEAKRRLKAFKTGDEQAVRWFQNAIPSAPADPTLRDMQLAVARSLDFPGWTELKRALETPPPEPQSEAVTMRGSSMSEGRSSSSRSTSKARSGNSIPS